LQALKSSGNPHRRLDWFELVSSLRLPPFGAPQRTAHVGHLEPFLVSVQHRTGGSMNPPRTPRAPTRTLAQFEESLSLQSAICEVVDARPVNESILRRAIWAYVGDERIAGTSPGQVILTLTELIEKSILVSGPEQHGLTRRVILWCVEAYYTAVAVDDEHDGHRVGDAVQLDANRPATAAHRRSS